MNLFLPKNWYSTKFYSKFINHFILESPFRNIFRKLSIQISKFCFSVSKFFRLVYSFIISLNLYLEILFHLFLVFHFHFYQMILFSCSRCLLNRYFILIVGFSFISSSLYIGSFSSHYLKIKLLNLNLNYFL